MIIKELGLTPEEFYKGFNDYLSNRKPEKIENPLDNLLKKGIPQGNYTILVGKSNVDSLLKEYVDHLIKQNCGRTI